MMSGSISVAVGIVVGLLASCVQSLGMTMQRKSHVLNQALPEEQQRPDYRRPYVSTHSVSHLLVAHLLSGYPDSGFSGLVRLSFVYIRFWPLLDASYVLYSA